MGTRWLYIQQALLKQHFPGSLRRIINGNIRWNFDLDLNCVWYDFIKIALNQPSYVKYFVHVDEDCFILNPNIINNYIQVLEEDDIDLIGSSDVVSRIRGENPIAMNSFFMLGKISTLIKVMEDYDINLKFSDLGINLDSPIEDYKIEYEPYYDFYWNYLKKGFRFKYIPSNYNEDFSCTALLTTQGEVWAYHMWFTRIWRRRKDYLHGVSQYDRYKRMGIFLKNHIIKNKFDIYSSVSLGDSFKVQWSRFIIKNINRLYRRLSRK